MITLPQLSLFICFSDRQNWGYFHLFLCKFSLPLFENPAHPGFSLNRKAKNSKVFGFFFLWVVSAGVNWGYLRTSSLPRDTRRWLAEKFAAWWGLAGCSWIINFEGKQPRGNLWKPFFNHSRPGWVAPLITHTHFLLILSIPC